MVKIYPPSEKSIEEIDPKIRPSVELLNVYRIIECDTEQEADQAVECFSEIKFIPNQRIISFIFSRKSFVLILETKK